MLWKLPRRRWLGAALLASPVSLLAQRDSAITRIVPLWRDGQLVTRVSGDPNVAGAPYVIRIWNFDNQVVLPHTHPEDEHIVVVQGTWFLAEGERVDRARLRPVAVGDYALVPRRQAHFAWSKGMTVIQVHGIGPFRVDFVDSVFVSRPARARSRVSAIRAGRSTIRRSHFTSAIVSATRWPWGRPGASSAKQSPRSPTASFNTSSNSRGSCRACTKRASCARTGGQADSNVA